MVERDALDRGSLAVHRRHSMLEDDGDLVLGEQVAKEGAVLGVVEATLKNAAGRAAHRLSAAPVDMAQAAARHATKPSRWLDHDDPHALPRRGYRRHDAAGRGAVDTHIHGIALVAPSLGRRQAA